jgi:ubiquinone biosynthesis protein COQ4
MPRRQPLVAVQALRKLIQDPSRTEEVFIIMRALSGNAVQDGAARFARTAVGRRVLTEQADILAQLTDRAALRRLPEDSLGRHYAAFADAAGITPEGLVEASNAVQAEYAALSPDEALYARRLRDTHDLWHVVAGFSTHTFGEVCVVAFSYGQTRNLGFAAIALIGALKTARESGQRGVLHAAWQAYRIGRRAAWLPAADWEALLAQSLNDVRSSLKLTPPTRYQALAESLEHWHGAPAAV